MPKEKKMPDGTEIRPEKLVIIHTGPGLIKTDDKNVEIQLKDR